MTKSKPKAPAKTKPKPKTKSKSVKERAIKNLTLSCMQDVRIVFEKYAVEVARVSKDPEMNFETAKTFLMLTLAGGIAAWVKAEYNIEMADWVRAWEDAV